MNVLKLGAIALTLIIAVPLCLGYSLASEDEEVERDIITSTNNMSEAILNATTEYYIDYNGPDNNSSLVKTSTGAIITPNYAEQGTNPTSMPVYTTVANSGTLNAGGTYQTSSTSVTSSHTYGTVGNPSTSVDVGTYTSFGWTYSSQSDRYTPTGVQTVPRMSLMWGFYMPDSRSCTIATPGPFGGTNEETVTLSEGLYYALPNDSVNGVTRARLVDWNGNVIYNHDSTFYVTPSSTTGIKVFTLSNINSMSDSDAYYTINARAITIVDSANTVHTIMGAPTMTNGVNSGTFYLYLSSGTMTVVVMDLTGTMISETSFEMASGAWTLKSFYSQPPYAISGEYHLTATPSNYTRDTATTVSIPYTDISYYGTVTLDTTGSSTITGITATITTPSDTTVVRYPAGWLTMTGTDCLLSRTSAGMGVTLAHSTQHTIIDGATNLEITVYGDAATLTLHKDPAPEVTVALSYDEWTLELPLSSVTITSGTGTTVLNGQYAPQYLFMNEGTLQAGSLNIPDVTGISVRTTANTLEYNYYTTTPTSDYANPAYGWQLPDGTGYVWFNSYENNYVRMMVTLFNPTTEFQVNNAGDVMTFTRTATMTTVTMGDTSTDLGNYSNIMIEFNVRNGIILISGLKEWGAMGTYPTVFNQITLPYSYSGDITSIKINSGGFNNYRVDSAAIIGGTFPSTKNFSLDLWSFYPTDDRQRLYINSIGVYGDTIGFGGRFYPVDTGTITLSSDGEEQVIPLNHLMIGITAVEGGYLWTLNGTELPLSTSSTLYLGGEWSLTLTRTAIGTETVVETHWVAGEFALDTDGFVLVMLLAAVGAFVVLGMTGARSGAKVGLLALICGGAAAVGLIIL